MILEACVETFEEALKAESLGVNRIELCDDLSVGGITPSYALLDSVKKQLKIPVMVMIRPRGRNFVYDSSELKLMKQSIDVCKSLGVMGVVFGILDQKNLIDIKSTKLLAEYASPLEVTFHKAIDELQILYVPLKHLPKSKVLHGFLLPGENLQHLKEPDILMK